ncbi:MAG: DUF2589 domain-containing protein [Bacteroidaceae bacterium]|nr:DUF2589 domain-containing protein [Bacteroidaceae bacterium]
MAIDTSPSQVATSALQAIPFGSMIGGPLKACIEAQAMAAQTSWQFIQEVGLNTNSQTGEKEAVNVSFQFMQNGRMAQLNVPLLTIVPIPYIAVHSIDINFKANISASSSSVSEQTTSEALDAGADISAKVGWGPFSLQANMKANYSSKKDSKATQNSQYSVEYTMDIAVKAGQDSMPAGLAKVLELLGSSLDVTDPNGTLELNLTKVKAGDRLIATYKNSDGLFDPQTIVNSNKELQFTIDGDNAVCVIPQTPQESYSITAGKKSVVVTVVTEKNTETVA